MIECDGCKVWQVRPTAFQIRRSRSAHSLMCPALHAFIHTLVLFLTLDDCIVVRSSASDPLSMASAWASPRRPCPSSTFARCVIGGRTCIRATARARSTRKTLLLMYVSCFLYGKLRTYSAFHVSVRSLVSGPCLRCLGFCVRLLAGAKRVEQLCASSRSRHIGRQTLIGQCSHRAPAPVRRRSPRRASAVSVARTFGRRACRLPLFAAEPGGGERWTALSRGRCR